MEDWPFPGESATLPAMSSQPTKLLHSNLIRWTVPLVAPLLVAVHVCLAPALQHTPPGQIADLTLRLAALLTVPLPLLVQATAAFFAAGLVFWIFSLFIPKINPKVVEIVSKVMGLFLTAIAIEMIAKGATSLFISLTAH